MSNMPERLQDPEIAAIFRSDYDELLAGQISPNALLEFHEHARSHAMVSVLAASVFSILGREIDEATKKHHDAPQVPRGRRHYLRRAGEAAKNIEALDELLRNPEAEEDLVLYGREKIQDKPGSFTGMYLTSTANAYVEHVGRLANEHAPESYWLIARPKYGVEVFNAIDGKATDWLQGSHHHFDVGLTDREGMGITDIALPYSHMDRGAYWKDAASVPAFVTGRSAIMEYFEKLLDKDLEEGYTENRWRRPSFSLFRMAHYLGDVTASQMFDMASAKGIINNWQNQMIDEEALGAALKFREFLARGLNYDEEAAKVTSIFDSFISLNFLDANWLQLTKEEIVERTLQHARRQGIEMTTADAHRVLDISMDYRHRRAWD